MGKKKSENKRLNVYTSLTKEDLEELDELARIVEVSRSEIISMFIVGSLENDEMRDKIINAYHERRSRQFRVKIRELLRFRRRKKPRH